MSARGTVLTYRADEPRLLGPRETETHFKPAKNTHAHFCSNLTVDYFIIKHTVQLENEQKLLRYIF